MTLHEFIELLQEVEEQSGDMPMREIPVNIIYQPNYPIKQEVAYLSIYEGELYLIGDDSDYASRRVYDNIYND
jgi:hypothetical protein